MKNKLLTAGLLAIGFVFASGVYALGQGGGSSDGVASIGQIQQQVQSADQKKDAKIQVQNVEQAQSESVGSSAAIDVGAGRQNLQNAGDNETGSQIQQQNQTADQGESSQIQIKNNEQNQTGVNAEMQPQQRSSDNGGIENQAQNQIQDQEREAARMQSGSGLEVAEQRKSQVADAVREILQVAERNGVSGQQAGIIAQMQIQNREKIEASLQKVQSRSGFAKFFIGPDYGEIKNAKGLLEQNKEQIRQLNEIKNQLSDQNDQQILTEQIQTLEQANLQIENSLENSQKGFSLFGWLFRIFSK
jgi:hypothetical protein